MIVKILGLLDIISALSFWLFALFHIIPQTLILIIAFYLLIKGAIFLISKDIASILDIICAGIIFLALNSGIPKFVAILVSLFLLQKGIFSLLA